MIHPHCLHLYVSTPHCDFWTLMIVPEMMLENAVLPSRQDLRTRTGKQYEKGYVFAGRVLAHLWLVEVTSTVCLE